MDKKEPGYVYILTNPSFREDWVKIGKITNMEERLRTLYNTSLPLPFEVFATMKTSKYNEAEKQDQFLTPESRPLDESWSENGLSWSFEPFV